MITNECLYNAYCLGSVFDCSLRDMIIWSGERFDESDVRVAAMQMILIFGFASVMNIGERKRHD